MNAKTARADKACRHVLSCPTTCWKVGRTTLHLTFDGRLIFARTYNTSTTAEARVASENANWERKVARYVEQGLTPPVQFTPAGRSNMIVWDGELNVELDAWGRLVK